MRTTGELHGGKAGAVGASADAAVRRGTSVPVDAELDSATAGARGASVQGGEVEDAAVQPAAPLHVAKTSVKRRGQMAQGTGIRQWSPADYTRVAIALRVGVTYA